MGEKILHTPSVNSESVIQRLASVFIWRNFEL